MRNRAILATLGAAAAGCVLLSTPLSASAAPTSGRSAANCWTFGNTTSFATYAGRVCGGTHVTGSYTDTKADGYCVFLRIHLASGTDDSPWACPKGAQRNFDTNYPFDYVQSVSIEKVYVP